MHDAGDDERRRHDDEKNETGIFEETAADETFDDSDQHHSHHARVKGTEEATHEQLRVLLCREGDDQLEDDGQKRHDVAFPFRYLQHGLERRRDGQYDSGWSEDGRRHQSALVPHVEPADVVVHSHRVARARQQVDDVGHGGRCPATPLVEEFVESLRGVGEGVRGRRVVDSVALLQQQSAQPSVLT